MKPTTVANKYYKVLVVAQRAKQLQQGALARVDIPSIRATRIALEEFERGFITFDAIADLQDTKSTGNGRRGA